MTTEPHTAAGWALLARHGRTAIVTTDVKLEEVLAVEAEAAELAGGLDAAWAEAEAALPRGWSFGLTPYWRDGGWYGWEVEAHADAYEFDGNRALSTGTLGAFPTPVAALHALAALRTCVYCSGPDHAGPCFGGDKCMSASRQSVVIKRRTGRDSTDRRGLLVSENGGRCGTRTHDPADVNRRLSCGETREMARSCSQPVVL